VKTILNQFLQARGGFWRQLILGALFLAAATPARAQWMTQNISLHPGWNAVYLHVTATQDTLENLVGAGSPISEIWLWVPSSSDAHFIANPLQPVSGSDWKQWTKAQGPANAFALRGNGAYLIRNSSAQNYAWSIKGQPAPPSNQWTASGLNFLGFSTRPDGAPLFANFLAPAPASGSPLRNADIFYYPGGEAAGAPPVTAQIFTVNTMPVTRGQAFWIRKQDNSDNRYFGPFDVVLKDYRGLMFSDSLGTHSFRLRNQIAATNRVTIGLLASESSPTGQTIAPPPLLLRTTRDLATLKYGFTNLPVNETRTFVLAPVGMPGSEIEVVVGLDRSKMTGNKGDFFAGILRLQDTTLGQLQLNLPVTATQASTDGLWIGNASITQVGNYLKTYAKATNAVDFAHQSAQFDALNEANKSVDLAGGAWSPSDIAATGANRNWQALASSANGINVVAAASGGQIYTSTDAGANWTAQAGAPTANWGGLASSADGTNLAAIVNGGKIYVSTDAGLTWAARENNRAWSSIASSANGLVLAACVDGGDLFTSTDGGVIWNQRAPVASQSWKSITVSADGKKLAAVINGGLPYASRDGGVTWVPLAGAPVAPWQAIASSADGRKLVAVANPGRIYTSTDGGVDWEPRANAPSANWLTVASSSNGNILVAAAADGPIYTSTDSGLNWTARDSNRNWSQVASASDASRIFAVEANGRFYSVVGTPIAPTLSYDVNSQQILVDNSKYLVASFDSELGAVPNPFPLRLIVHRGSNGVTRLLQRVFVGADKATTNSIVTRQESDLHPAYLSQARRVSAVHLPLTSEGWALKGAFAAGGIMNAVLNDSFNDQASNPFLHTYHPDHDNLDAFFKPISKPGVESYDINRQITLSFTPPDDDDFNSRTVGAANMQGVYLENIVLKGSDSQSRTIVTKGTFVLNRVSSIATLQ